MLHMVWGHTRKAITSVHSLQVFGVSVRVCVHCAVSVCVCAGMGGLHVNASVRLNSVRFFDGVFLSTQLLETEIPR